MARAEQTYGAAARRGMAKDDGRGEHGGRAAENGRGKTNGRMRLFLRSSAFDFLLVLVLSCALVFTVSYGFESAPDLRGNLALEAGVCAML